MALIFSMASRNNLSAVFQLKQTIRNILNYYKIYISQIWVAAVSVPDLCGCVETSLGVSPGLQYTKCVCDIWERWTEQCVNDSLSILKGDHCYFVYDKRVLWSNTKSLAEETFCQLGVVGQTILQADVEHRQVTPGRETQPTKHSLCFRLKKVTLNRKPGRISLKTTLCRATLWFPTCISELMHHYSHLKLIQKSKQTLQIYNLCTNSEVLSSGSWDQLSCRFYCIIPEEVKENCATFVSHVPTLS